MQFVVMHASRFLDHAASNQIADAHVTWVERDYVAWVENAAVRSSFINVSGASLEKNASQAENVISVDLKKGKGNFHSVQDAVDSISKGNNQRTTIQIAAGVYKEKVKIPRDKPYITFQGAGKDVTKITWHDTAKKSKSTFRSATVAVMADNFIAKDLAFENAAPSPTPGQVRAQAVAFQISGDRSAFYDCAFYGAQDTLYDHKGRHYFKNCLIQGSIDFIFGDGLSLYEGCQLHTISTSAGSLTAQKRKSSTEDTGFSFLNCSVSGSGIVYLGRAWGAYSRVVYIDTYIDDIILPGGWYNWGIKSREKTVFYGQYKCFGPGANLNNKVAWSHELTEAQAAPFMSLSFIDGQSWLPT